VAFVQQQCNNARRCHNNNDPTLCAHDVQQTIIEKGFANAAKAIDKKCTAPFYRWAARSEEEGDVGHVTTDAGLAQSAQSKKITAREWASNVAYI
jgi:hypothetical protein